LANAQGIQHAFNRLTHVGKIIDQQKLFM